VQCFFHHDFYIYGDKQKDTAFFEPHTKSVIHYRQNRYFLVGGTTSDPVNSMPSEIPNEFHPLSRDETHIDHAGITSFSIGKANYRGLEGTWRDAEDGVLSRYPIEQGSVDSTVEIDCVVRGDRGTWVYVWVCAGKKISEVHGLQHFLLEETPEQVKQSARNYWRGWVGSHMDPHEKLPKEVMDLYVRSLLTVRTQIDNHGGILAANDSDIMQFNRDTYTYVWPRDGAFVCMALTRAGQTEVVRRFFEFCEKAQTKEGYLLHKYNPDGSAGSSWHPWYRGRQSILPIQGDETALPLLALWRHFEHTQDFEFLHALYQKFVRHGADFLVRYTEADTGLPLPSYDPWEEHRGVFTYTTAATCAGLRAASHISAALGHYRHADRYGEAADRMTEAMFIHLYDESTKSFLKKIKRENGATIERDTTPDASIGILWMFDILPPNDPRVVSTIERLERVLTVRTPIGGIARYQNDYYQSVTPPTQDIPGNPWIITTLWFAEWRIATAKTLQDLERPLKDLQWVAARASTAGMLPEQVHPLTGAPLSVAPLTWSHATFIEAVLMFAAKKKQLTDKNQESEIKNQE
jgi:GH15 family glucan-1,4-alpha-glucosidase